MPVAVKRPPGCIMIPIRPSVLLFGLTEATSNAGAFAAPAWARTGLSSALITSGTARINPPTVGTAHVLKSPGDDARRVLIMLLRRQTRNFSLKSSLVRTPYRVERAAPAGPVHDRAGEQRTQVSLQTFGQLGHRHLP